MRHAYRPGERTARRYAGYSPSQEVQWQALDDAYHAACFGFDRCRLPSPREDLGPPFKDWLVRVQAAWASESGRVQGTVGVKNEDWPEGLWAYLYQTMRGKNGANRTTTPSWY
mgnify:FL=1